jgi:hypothetical protein
METRYDPTEVPINAPVLTLEKRPEVCNLQRSPWGVHNTCP